MSSAKWLPFCPGGDELSNALVLVLHSYKLLLSVALCVMLSLLCRVWIAGIILGMGSANERRRYYVTPSLIG